MTVCAACSVTEGVCRVCGVYWMTKPGGKRYGVRPVAEPIPTMHIVNGRTVPLYWTLGELPNVTTLPTTLTCPRAERATSPHPSVEHQDVQEVARSARERGEAS